MILDQFWLTDAQFSKIAPHLPTETRGKARVDDRRVISGIVQVLKSGGRWIDAPPEYGPKKTLYNRYVRWAAKGVWMDLFHVLAQAGGPPVEVLIDSSAVKAHRSASGGKGEKNQAIGRSRGFRRVKSCTATRATTATPFGGKSRKTARCQTSRPRSIENRRTAFRRSSIAIATPSSACSVD